MEALYKADRRVEQRSAKCGKVEISFEDPTPVKIEAELVETSATGFRVAHDSKALNPGLEVHYQYPSRSGRARVIWTHVLEGRRVSGFLVL